MEHSHNPRPILLHAVRYMLAACAMLLVCTAQARGADSSAWSENLHAAMRLIAGTNTADAATLTAGVEVRLDPGWHTYWRYPGDAGVPPRFDFSGSQNAAKVRVRYPAPQAIVDETGTTLGYQHHVVFPLQITPTNPGRPVTLHLNLDYAICEKLCVPAKGETTLVLAAGQSSHAKLLAAAEARVPQPVDAAKLGLTARRGKDGADVLVELAAPKDTPVQLFVEGPTAEWALPVPKPVGGAPAGKQRFSFTLDGLPPGVKPQAPADLTFTAVEGDRAYQTKVHLD
jgi:DsbC/DsbD-like thiol-disulfide interchange protein